MTIMTALPSYTNTRHIIKSIFVGGFEREWVKSLCGMLFRLLGSPKPLSDVDDYPVCKRCLRIQASKKAQGH